MSCACIYVDNDEPLDPCAGGKVRAIRDWPCEECADGIKAGDIYDQYVVDYNDPGNDRFKTRHKADIRIFRTCLDCLSVTDEMFCGGWVFGQVWADVYDHLWDIDGEVDSECLMALTPKARVAVIEMIDEVWKEREYEDEDDL